MKFIKARDILTDRGPDDCGVFFDDKNEAALGHRRLSIIDLSPLGRQPMKSQNGHYHLIFNGEIFNFTELRQELTDYPFKTKTDSEVLLAAYIKWGYKCLDKLNGQFAFVIYNSQTGEAFCGRDRLGIKPFYYFLDKNFLVLASEIKALLALGIPAEPDNKSIFEYLYYNLYDHSENTFFRNIKRLLPGHFAVWKNNKFSLRSYWDLAEMKNREGGYSDMTKDEAVELFKALVADSVRLQFRSDVPVGLNLSSGLDSMSLLFFVNSVVGGRIHSFSAGLSDSHYDELRHLKKSLTSSQKELLHSSVLTPERVWFLAEKLMDIQDEPYGGLSTIHYFNLYDETKISDVTVLLEGQGMDEILAGYRYYRNGRGKGNLSQDMTKEGARDVLNPDFLKRFSGQDGLQNIIRPFRSILLNKQYRDIHYAKLPRVLRFNDHISLAYGKELRVPYLDHRLVEFCFFLPDKFKIDGSRQKVLLREAMRGIVPDVNKEKSKFAFGAFQTDWLRRYFKKEVYEIIESVSFRGRPFWDWKKIRKKANNFFEGQGDNSFFLWQWLNLEMWFKKYIDK